MTFPFANTGDDTLFQPSEKAVARVRELLERQKSGVATEAEGRELEQALQLEHLMRLAKIKVLQGKGLVDTSILPESKTN